MLGRIRNHHVFYGKEKAMRKVNQQRSRQFPLANRATLALKFLSIAERFHSRDQQLCKFIGTRGSVNVRKESNSYRIGSGHQKEVVSPQVVSPQLKGFFIQSNL